MTQSLWWYMQQHKDRGHKAQCEKRGSLSPPLLGGWRDGVEWRELSLKMLCAESSILESLEFMYICFYKARLMFN